MIPTSASDNDFVTVDMPSGTDTPAAIAATTAIMEDPSEDNNDGQNHNNNRDGEGDVESASDQQRSLLKTLWSEATSTTDLPGPTSTSLMMTHNDRLHHRRGAGANNNAGAANYSTTGTGGSVSSPSKYHYARKGSQGSVTSTKRRGRHSSAASNRYRMRRGAKIAKRVWLAAFAAFAAAFLIAIHVFLYRVFTGTGNSSMSKNNDYLGSSLAGAVMKNDMPILAMEDKEVKMTLEAAHSHKLKSIMQHSIDTSQYTIRINTWQRNEQLLLSLNHHSKCEGVKEIQVIWCDSNNEPPDEIVHHESGKVKIEKHAINSLNERFKVLMDTPTLGVLSLDDDVIRPCAALDAAFVRWVRHPDRMVGFDARSHVVVDDKWKYGYMSTTESSNRYSMTLPRASFMHRDYLDLYTMALPRPIYTYVAENLECEDIAMSFLVSSLTGGKPPLVADYWAVKSMVKLYAAKKISGGKNHKKTRDNCVNDFADLLGLKGAYPLQTGKLLHNDHFLGYGAEFEQWSDIDQTQFKDGRLRRLISTMQELQDLPHERRMGWLGKQKSDAEREAKRAGMIDGTQEWKARWENGG